MLTTPIVEGAYYEREDGSIRIAYRMPGEPALFALCDGTDGSGILHRENGAPCITGEPLITRRVYIVPTDPAEVVAELREQANMARALESDEQLGEAARAQAIVCDEFADLVAEKLGVQS